MFAILLFLLCFTGFGGQGFGVQGFGGQGFGPIVNPFEFIGHFEPMSPLQSLVSFRAIGSSIYSTLQKDFGSENLVFDAIFKSHFHPEMDAIYLGLITMSALKAAEPDRLSNIEIYTDIYKKTRIVLFVLTAVLTKNIENAV